MCDVCKGKKYIDKVISEWFYVSAFVDADKKCITVGVEAKSRDDELYIEIPVKFCPLCGMVLEGD